MKENKGLKVGQVLYVKRGTNAAIGGEKIIEAKINSIGRKYFTLDSFRRRFFIDNLTQDNGDYTSNYVCYLSMQDIEDEIEANKLAKDIKQLFEYCHKRLSLEKLKEIHKIITAEQ